ncbi:MAG: iron-containing alcohol dehydrogenase [Deltaproteobacteria bacterium]|nr:iron-containing alcohol dehydrogenase [Deltaproteobacteria bacterium]
MKNFVFEVPTKIVFGQSTIGKIGGEIKSSGCRKILFVYGMDSIKDNGVYNKVVASLQEACVDFTDFGSVRSNPLLSRVYQGIEAARNEGVDGILAVGGGSVIDSAKAIAAGVKSDCDVWDFFTYKATVERALPLFCVLTVSASASEMNGAAVITNEDGARKFSVRSPLLVPRVSILDPSTLFTLAPSYTAYSAVDVITHMLEAYFNNSESNSIIQDGFVHTLMKTVISSTNTLLDNPYDYNARANFMWSATLGFNGLTSAGLGPFGFPAHMIEHSLSALYDIAHGAGLAIVLPAWMEYYLVEKENRYQLLGKEVFGVASARNCVDAMKGWFNEIGAPTTLREANIPFEDIPKIAANAYELAKVWGLNKNYTADNIAAILALAK